MKHKPHCECESAPAITRRDDGCREDAHRRDDVAEGRDDDAEGRDAVARLRDVVAEHRDETAEERDQEARRTETTLHGAFPGALDGDSGPRAQRGLAASDRREAREDRRRAAAERGGAARDRATALSDRDEAAAVLASSLEEIQRFHSLVEACGEFVLIAGRDGAVSFVNPAGRRMIGLDADRDVRGTAMADYLTAQGREAFNQVQHPAVLAHGHWEGRSTLRHRGGGPPIPVTVSTFLMHDPESHEPIALATVQRDVSDLLAAERATVELAEQRRRLLERLVQAQEDERSRIAADVHDDSVQALASVDLRLGLVLRQLAGSDPSTLASLTSAHLAVSDATNRLRHLLFDLDSPALRTDLTTAVREAATFVLEGSGARCRVTSDTEPELSPAERVTLYRVAKEALINVRKHAGASIVDVSISDQDAGLQLSVTDDGCGVDTTTLRDQPGHLGIAGMRDRAELAGGWLRFDSEPGAGSEVQLWIPRTGT